MLCVIADCWNALLKGLRGRRAGHLQRSFYTSLLAKEQQAQGHRQEPLKWVAEVQLRSAHHHMKQRLYNAGLGCAHKYHAQG